MPDIERRMRGAVGVLRARYAGLRTGRASVALLQPVTVAAYGNQTPISQVASISVPDPRMLTVQVWDSIMVKAVDKAIRASGLGLNPIVEGQLLRVPIPELNEERRIELCKIAAEYAEQARVSVRNVRRGLLKHEDGEMSQDEHKLWTREVQAMTNSKIEEIDRTFADKEHEILQV